MFIDSFKSFMAEFIEFANITNEISFTTFKICKKHDGKIIKYTIKSNVKINVHTPELIFDNFLHSKNNYYVYPVTFGTTSLEWINIIPLVEGNEAECKFFDIEVEDNDWEIVGLNKDDMSIISSIETKMT